MTIESNNEDPFMKKTAAMTGNEDEFMITTTAMTGENPEDEVFQAGTEPPCIASPEDTETYNPSLAIEQGGNGISTPPLNQFFQNIKEGHSNYAARSAISPFEDTKAHNQSFTPEQGNSSFYISTPSQPPRIIRDGDSSNYSFSWNDNQLFGQKKNGQNKKGKNEFVAIGKDFDCFPLEINNNVIAIKIQSNHYFKDNPAVILKMEEIHVNFMQCIKKLVAVGISIMGDPRAQRMLREYLTDVIAQQHMPYPATDKYGWSVNKGIWTFTNLAVAITQSEQQPTLLKEEAQGQIPYTNNFLGTLFDWQNNVAVHCLGNLNLVFIISASLASIFLHWTNSKGFAVNFFGGSSCGKSTALCVGGSAILRMTEEPLLSWRTTDNGLEKQCFTHNDYALFLDELGECEPSALKKIIYMVANGQAKQRATQSKTLSWKCIVLSSSELPAKSHIEATAEYPAGLAMRFLDLPAEVEGGYGIFHRIPENFAGANEFSQYLQSASEIYRGTALQALLHTFFQEGMDLLNQLHENIRVFTTMATPSQTNGQIQRVLRHFALIAATGEIGIKYSILPWPKGHANDSALYAFQVWLEHYNESSKTFRDRVLDRLFSTLQRYGESKFLPYRERTTATGNLKDSYGYRRQLPGGITELIIPDDGFEKIFEGLLIRNCCDVLSKDGILLREGRNFKIKRTLPGNPAARCYVLRISSDPRRV